ncbi:MAG: hypothetical protein R3F59_27195 [Myxococcota bacterium]
MRGHFTKAAESLLKDQRFDVSLAAVRTITEFEPDKATEMAPLEKRILDAWGDDVVKQAVVQPAGATSARRRRCTPTPTSWRAGRPTSTRRASWRPSSATGWR